jgi:hypothetical protein
MYGVVRQGSAGGWKGREFKGILLASRERDSPVLAGSQWYKSQLLGVARHEKYNLFSQLPSLLLIWTRCIDRENLNTTPFAFTSTLYSFLPFAEPFTSPLHPPPPFPSLRLSSLLVERSVVSWVEGFSSHRRPNALPPSRRRNCRV